MPKNIVILFDGTSNEVTENRTNVLRLYGTLRKDDRQLVWYDPGVGTIGAVDTWFPIRRKLGGGLGHADGMGPRPQCEGGLPLPGRELSQREGRDRERRRRSGQR